MANKISKNQLTYCDETGTILEGIKVGVTVYDDLASRPAMIIKLLDNGALKLDSEYLEGLRHSWEISILKEDMSDE